MQTPQRHGEIFAIPRLEAMADCVTGNAARTARRSGSKGGFDWAGRIEAARKDIYQAGAGCHQELGIGFDWPGESEGARVIATGHQCQFFHAGIFIKYAVLGALAGVTGGVAVNYVVDHDLPKSDGLMMPVRKMGEAGQDVLHVDGIAFADDAALAMEYQQLDKDELLRQLDGMGGWAVADEVKPRLKELLPLLRETLEGAVDLASFFVLLNRRIGERFGLRWVDVPVSRLADTGSFYAFLGDIIGEAERFTTCYNQALNRYRVKHKVRGVSQPLPDLHVPGDGGDYYELPFWVVNAEGERGSLGCCRGKDGVVLYGAGEVFARCGGGLAGDGEQLRECIAGAGKGVRPKAVTLTMWARLFGSDYFIHGIGGGQYDQITDQVIKDFYAVEPPAYAVTSATLRLGLGQFRSPDDIEQDLGKIEQERREMQYNPQRFTEQQALDKLIKQREEAVALVQKLKEIGGSAEDKQKVFQLIHDINDQLQERTQFLTEEVERRRKTLQVELEQAEIAGGREYFVGLIEGESLQELVDRVASAIGGR